MRISFVTSNTCKYDHSTPTKDYQTKAYVKSIQPTPETLDFAQQVVAGERTFDINSSMDGSGAEVNAKSEYGATPLHWASQEGYTDIVKLLIEKGADVNAKDEEGKTPLNWASEGGHTDIVKLLVEKGAMLLPPNFVKPPSVENGRTKSKQFVKNFT